MVTRLAGLFLAASLVLGFAPPATGAWKGVWLSIESPVNPYDNANRNVLLFVHTFWMQGSAAMPVEGRAEGVVDGVRRSVPLAFEARGDGGVYAVSRSWPGQGRWALVITARNRGQQATALVRLSDDGRVAAVQVTPDRGAAEADVAAALR